MKTYKQIICGLLNDRAEIVNKEISLIHDLLKTDELKNSLSSYVSLLNVLVGYMELRDKLNESIYRFFKDEE